MSTSVPVNLCLPEDSVDYHINTHSQQNHFLPESEECYFKSVDV